MLTKIPIKNVKNNERLVHEMKKIISLALTLIFVFALSVNAMAAAPAPIEPLWDNTNSVMMDFSLNGASSYAIGEVMGKSNTAYIQATVKVYRLEGNSYVLINEVTKTEYSNYIFVATPFAAYTGNCYKAVLVFHVTNTDGVTESIQKAKNVCL